MSAPEEIYQFTVGEVMLLKRIITNGGTSKGMRGDDSYAEATKQLLDAEFLSLEGTPDGSGLLKMTLKGLTAWNRFVLEARRTLNEVVKLPEQQRKTPCQGCPFSKTCEPGELGGSGVEVYLGQANGPFWLPCHSGKGYAGKQTDPNRADQCAGAAIFRSNVGAQKTGTLLDLPADGGEKVFESYEEFMSHHMKIPVPVARALLSTIPVAEWTKVELQKAEAKQMLMRRKE